VAIAVSLGLFGSLDANRNDYQYGWDTDSFPNNAAEIVPPYQIIKRRRHRAGRPQCRRQGAPPVDRSAGHIIIGMSAARCAPQAMIAPAQAHRGGDLDPFLAEALCGMGQAREKEMSPARPARGTSGARRARAHRSKAEVRAARNIGKTC